MVDHGASTQCFSSRRSFRESSTRQQYSSQHPMWCKFDIIGSSQTKSYWQHCHKTTHYTNCQGVATIFVDVMHNSMLEQNVDAMQMVNVKENSVVVEVVEDETPYTQQNFTRSTCGNMKDKIQKTVESIAT